MNYIRIIHMAKNKAGLDEDCYRLLLQGAAGVTSSTEVKSAFQYNRIRDAFRKLGVKLPYDPGRPYCNSPLQKKAYALWCELYEDGKVQSKGWAAFEAFRRREMGDADIMQHSQWVHFIEILKKFLER